MFCFTPVKNVLQKSQRTISLTIFELSFCLQFSREIQKLVERSEAALIQSGGICIFLLGKQEWKQVRNEIKNGA